jgi:hypothetical protein
MARRGKAGYDVHHKLEEIEKRNRARQRETKRPSEQLHAENDSTPSLRETPFRPRMEEHAATLSRIPFSVQRQKFITHLLQTYGNGYVQRLMESMKVPAKLNISTQVPPQGNKKVIQRAQAPMAVRERNDFKDVEYLITSHGLNKAFGLTFPMVIHQLNPELQGEIWQFIGLMEGQKDVEDEETTLDNWEAKIKGLASMGLEGEWYSREAVRAHEDVHLATFQAITNEKEKTIREKGQNALWYWRSFCNKGGEKDHTSGATDEAELPIIKEKIEHVWEEASALLKEQPGKTEYTIKSQYQQVLKFPIFGKKKQKILAQVKLKPTGFVSF